jgi:hypothetical protein
MTLIAVYTSEGCVGRCDARCYNAHTADCDCICGGANHGAGFDRAVDNTCTMFEEWIGAYVKEKHLTSYRAEIADEVIQTRMF